MPHKKTHSISIFFPCYNDSKSIGGLVRNAFTIAQKLTKDYEVIVVDDGSSDNSRAVLKNLRTKYPRLRLIFHKRNKGYGGALRSGFKAASKELVFYTDGDGQYDIKELPILVHLMTDDVDFVNGMKMSRNDPSYRIFLGNLHKFLMRWLFWLPITDIDCDFRLIRQSILRKINLSCNTGAICVELAMKAGRAGTRFREVDVHHYRRMWGQSQFFRLDRIIKTYWELLRLWTHLKIFGSKLIEAPRAKSPRNLGPRSSGAKIRRSEFASLHPSAKKARISRRRTKSHANNRV